MALIECRNCRGKGHVMDGFMLFPLAFFLWPFAIAERNDKDGATRNICKHCNGEGYIRISK